MTEFEAALHKGEEAISAGNLPTALDHYGRAIKILGASSALIGDSHFRYFVGVHGMAQLWLGPVTMHRVARDGAALIDNGRLGLKAGSAIGFCFGEIDCRNHLYRHAPSGLQNAAEDLVERYLSSVRSIADRARCKAFVATPPPPMRTIGPLYAHLAAPLDARIESAAQISRSLISKAAIHDVAVVDVYGMFEQNGMMPDELSNDGIHIHQPEALLSIVLATQAVVDRLLKAP